MDAPQDDQPRGTCITCQPRNAEEGQLVCGPCAVRIRHRLRDLTELHADLGADQDAGDDWVGSLVTDDHGRPVKGKDGQRQYHQDPALPAGPLRGRSVQPHVSGTAEPSVPVDLFTLDLNGGIARDGGIPVDKHRAVQPWQLVPLVRVERVMRRQWVEGVMHEFPVTEKRAVLNARGKPILVPAVDELGALPIARRLDEHVLRWIAARGQREHRPVPTVAGLVAWLAARLDWAYKHDQKLSDLDADVRKMIAQVRGVLGQHEPEPERIEGVPCQWCDNRGTLYRIVGDPYINCSVEGCRKLYTEAELKTWVDHLADALKRQQRKTRARTKLKPIEGAA